MKEELIAKVVGFVLVSVIYGVVVIGIVTLKAEKMEYIVTGAAILFVFIILSIANIQPYKKD